MISITVRGIPAPQGSKRHVGNGRMVESSKAVGPWREAVRAETQRAMQDMPSPGGPVSVRIRFLLPRPKSHYRTGKNAHLLRPAMVHARPAGMPDADKLARSALDGLTAGGAWKDDGQVVDLHVSKHYPVSGGLTGCYIEISEVAG